MHGDLAPRFLTRMLLLTAAALAIGAPVSAQLDPTWDHYKVYDLNPKPVHNQAIRLIDQFGVSNHIVMELDCFANPVMKEHGGNISPIHDPSLHYAWWRISDEPVNVPVLVTNQFGDQEITAVNARYLLNPALKNEPGPDLPVANHYKCYDCIGDPVNVPVFLTDQFYGRPAQVMAPRLLCNPVEKQTMDNEFYPPLDPNQHYVCYDIDPFPDMFPAVVSDQFVQDLEVQLGPDKLLCVPSLKFHEPTPTKSDTWGRLKILYR
jgi:hypothetical protein